MNKVMEKITPVGNLVPIDGHTTVVYGNVIEGQDESIALPPREEITPIDTIKGIKQTTRARREDSLYPVAVFIRAFIEESKESTQFRAKRGAKCRDRATEDSDFLLTVSNPEYRLAFAISRQYIYAPKSLNSNSLSDENERASIDPTNQHLITNTLHFLSHHSYSHS
ncbi:hypothetical protein QVD17_25701 [Tagetes erecta]|uniref:Uncharacterized protein n=1 Tax=Tagetes erecta TaxID=13708 RepID=A0AAD8NVJ1_TARER|nr:hypothetical protein QVD17_25701 [Tagetes erecta]